LRVKAWPAGASGLLGLACLPLSATFLQGSESSLLAFCLPAGYLSVAEYMASFFPHKLFLLLISEAYRELDV
jgi:hypothetical protein